MREVARYGERERKACRDILRNFTEYVRARCRGMSADPASWSAAFEADALRPIERIPPPDEITREWAWGGSTGKGVKVAVIDSGVDADHPAVGHVEYAPSRPASETSTPIRTRTLRSRNGLRRDHPHPRAGLLITSVKVLGAA